MTACPELVEGLEEVKNLTQAKRVGRDGSFLNFSKRSPLYAKDKAKKKTKLKAATRHKSISMQAKF